MKWDSSWLNFYHSGPLERFVLALRLNVFVWSIAFFLYGHVRVWARKDRFERGIGTNFGPCQNEFVFLLAWNFAVVRVVIFQDILKFLIGCNLPQNKTDSLIEIFVKVPSALNSLLQNFLIYFISHLSQHLFELATKMLKS